MKYADKELQEKIETILGEVEDRHELKELMEPWEGFEYVDNGNEWCAKAKIPDSDKWLFIDNNGYISEEISGCWKNYFSAFDPGEDDLLEEYDLTDLIDYDEVDDDHEGEVRVFRITHYSDGTYNAPKTGWERDDYSSIKIFDSLEEAKTAYPEETGIYYFAHGELAPVEYIFCRV
jgi:hypothetical protein